MKAWKALGPDRIVLEQYDPEKVGKNEVKIKNNTPISLLTAPKKDSHKSNDCPLFFVLK